MTVLVRPKRVETIRRRRQASGRRPAERPAPAASSPASAEYPIGHENPPDKHRLATDHALYNCQCGYVFQAPVSTSVGCPHCGGTQAW
jgi:hypothetical protein